MMLWRNNRKNGCKRGPRSYRSLHECPPPAKQRERRKKLDEKRHDIKRTRRYINLINCKLQLLHVLYVLLSIAYPACSAAEQHLPQLSFVKYMKYSVPEFFLLLISLLLLFPINLIQTIEHYDYCPNTTTCPEENEFTASTTSLPDAAPSALIDADNRPSFCPFINYENPGVNIKLMHSSSIILPLLLKITMSRYILLLKESWYCINLWYLYVIRRKIFKGPSRYKPPLTMMMLQKIFPLVKLVSFIYSTTYYIGHYFT